MTKKEIHSDNPILLLIVTTSFGEVDWILPVLKTYLEKNRTWRLITVFGHKTVFDTFKLSSPILFNRFMEISALNIVPQELNQLFSSGVNPDQIKIIFKDYNRDEFSPIKSGIASICPNAMVVNFPHSCHIYSNLEKEEVSTCENPDGFSRHDLFLLDSEHDIPFWSNYVDIQKIRALGYPRYDSWWIDTLLKNSDLESNLEFQKANKADTTFFYISRSAHPHYLSQEDYEYLIRSTADVVFSYDNALLLIKPHPRQDINELFQLLKPYDKDRYIVSGLHLMQLSLISDIVISGWSSGILDALSVDKPVIEFWKFGGRDPICRKDGDGNYTTIYRELGLAASANTSEELENLVSQAINDPGASIWQSQRRAFDTHCKFTDQACQNIVAMLETELKKRNDGGLSSPGDPDPVRHSAEAPYELIDRLIEYISDLVEDQKEEEAGKWLEFLNKRFPGDEKILNNLSIFLFNQGNADKAVEYLMSSLNIFPNSVETVTNLIQILLLVDKNDDALNIVVSFFSNASAEVRKEFLQLMSKQLTGEQFSSIQLALKQLSG